MKWIRLRVRIWVARRRIRRDGGFWVIDTDERRWFWAIGDTDDE